MFIVDEVGLLIYHFGASSESLMRHMVLSSHEEAFLLIKD